MNLKVNRRMVIWTSSGWIGVILFLVALVALVWSLHLLAQFVASLSMMAFVIMLAVLFQEYLDWIEGQMKAAGLEEELVDLGWEPLPTVIKMEAETTREIKLRAAGGHVDRLPEPTPQLTPPPRVGPDLTDAFHRWKERPPLPDQPSFTELVAQVTGEPELASTPTEAQEIVDQVVEKYPFLPKPEGLELEPHG